MAIAYPAAVFALLEGAALVLPSLDVPAWTFRALMGAAVLGFPLTMVLTWDYDVTSRGIVRTPDEPTSDDPPEPPTWRVVAFVVASCVLGWILRALR